VSEGLDPHPAIARDKQINPALGTRLGVRKIMT
jgi:hypothetical protein